MRMWIVVCQASTPAFDRESLHAWLFRRPRLSHAGRAALAGGRGTAATTLLRGAAMKEIPCTPVHSSAGTPRGFAMSTPPVTSAGVNASGGTASPGALVESPPSVSEEDEVDDSLSLKLEGGLPTS